MKSLSLLRKILSCILGAGIAYSLTYGFLLLISNIQGQRVPDGYPLDPWWLVIGLLFVVPLLAGFLAIAIWPKEAQEKKKKKLQLPKKKKKFYSRPTLYVGRSKDSLM